MGSLHTQRAQQQRRQPKLFERRAQLRADLCRHGARDSAQEGEKWDGSGGKLSRRAKEADAAGQHIRNHDAQQQLEERLWCHRVGRNAHLHCHGSIQRLLVVSVIHPAVALAAALATSRDPGGTRHAARGNERTLGKVRIRCGSERCERRQRSTKQQHRLPRG